MRAWCPIRRRRCSWLRAWPRVASTYMRAWVNSAYTLLLAGLALWVGTEVGLMWRFRPPQVANDDARDDALDQAALAANRLAHLRGRVDLATPPSSKASASADRERPSEVAAAPVVAVPDAAPLRSSSSEAVAAEEGEEERGEATSPVRRGEGLRKEAEPASRPSRAVHIFYYAWYLNVDHDGRWSHWDHEHLPHWDANVRRRYPPFKHDPSKDDVGAAFWPALGAYSSLEAATIDAHMRMIARARVGVVVLSWYSPGHQDGNGENTDGVVAGLLEAAARQDVEVALHLEPYAGRTAASVRADVDFALAKYGTHGAFHRRGGRPVFYAYDSYQIAPEDWRRALADSGAFVVGLVLDGHHLDAYGPVFDATYSYFGATGFTEASTPGRWALFLGKKSADFIPCVSPGYDDSRVRPWNGDNTRTRRDGAYYDDMWRAALDAGARTIGLTSFNEWHEGTQIEDAVPHEPSRDAVPPYQDYAPQAPSFYLDRTRAWVDDLERRRHQAE